MVEQSRLGADDGTFVLEGDGTGWGYNVGVLLGPWRSLRLGLAYRSRIEVDVDGEATITGIAPPLQPLFGGGRFETDADTTLRFPEIYSIGLAWDPTPRWTLAADFEWVRWSSLDRTFVDFEKEVPAAGIVDGSTTLDWRDSSQVKVGAEFRPDEHVALRTGYAYIRSPVPGGTLEPGNPDANSHNLTVGGGYKWERFWVDTFYMAVIYEDRKVDNDILSGEYKNFAHFLGVSLGYEI
jgi:long-chain fatty acid transport protein